MLTEKQIWLTYSLNHDKMKNGGGNVTITEIKTHFGNYSLCVNYISILLEIIEKYQKKLSNKRLDFAHEEYRQMIEWIREDLKRNKDYEEKILSLFDYCESDYDRKLIRRRYIEQEKLFNIAYDICYSERMTQILYKRIFQKLAANTKDLPNIKF